jgi:hypothetical protein
MSAMQHTVPVGTAAAAALRPAGASDTGLGPSGGSRPAAGSTPAAAAAAAAARTRTPTAAAREEPQRARNVAGREGHPGRRAEDAKLNVVEGQREAADVEARIAKQPLARKHIALDQRIQRASPAAVKSARARRAGDGDTGDAKGVCVCACVCV